MGKKYVMTGSFPDGFKASFTKKNVFSQRNIIRSAILLSSTWR